MANTTIVLEEVYTEGKRGIERNEDLIMPVSIGSRQTEVIEQQILPDFIFIKSTLKEIFLKEFRTGIISMQELLVQLNEHDIKL